MTQNGICLYSGACFPYSNFSICVFKHVMVREVLGDTFNHRHKRQDEKRSRREGIGAPPCHTPLSSPRRPGRHQVRVLHGKTQDDTHNRPAVPTHRHTEASQAFGCRLRCASGTATPLGRTAGSTLQARQAARPKVAAWPRVLGCRKHTVRGAPRESLTLQGRRNHHQTRPTVSERPGLAPVRGTPESGLS